MGRHSDGQGQVIAGPNAYLGATWQCSNIDVRLCLLHAGPNICRE